MTLPQSLLPLAVLLPLGVAALLLSVAHWLPPRVGDGVAVLTALVTGLLCAWLAREALAGSVIHWFGGWTPAASGRAGVVLGVSFLADPASAAVAAFCALLFAASFVFAWGYFDAVHAHFHILMLLFLAAIVGFGLTHDLFNMFVWFELMSVAAFALTAYPLGGSALEGAFNFTIVSALASFLMLAGTGLLYARAGTLDMTALGAAIHRPDPVITGAYCLLATALLTKAAILPFHFWLSDAHTVAPSPVSVIFSGAMVSMGLFGLAKLTGQVFAHDAAVLAIVHGVLRGLGLATAITGALMAWAQRHLKRLLAFSTIAHMGIMLIALSATSAAGNAGLLLYLVAHGLVKAPLFMVAGILLARLNSVDEITLYAKGRALWPVGGAMTLGALLLGGAPVGLLHGATELIHAAAPAPAIRATIIGSAALTGAAVLRAAARIFAGASGVPGAEARAPTERDSEKSDRPLWLMLAPCVALLTLALLPAEIAGSLLPRAAARLVDADGGAVPALPQAGALADAIVTPMLMLAIVALSLIRTRPTAPRARQAARAGALPFTALQALHSGMLGDYAMWLAVGLAALTVAAGAG